MSIKRRTFLKRAAAGTVAGATLSAPAIAAGRRRLKMVTTWPKNFPGVGTGAERLARRITEASDGQLTVRVLAAGELVPAFSSFDAVSSGTAEMYHGADYYWQGKSKAFNFYSAVPFGMTGPELAAWIRVGGGQELWDELCAPFGIKPFFAGGTGAQMGGWFKKEINSLEDFKGLKIRMPGLGGEVLRRLGAAAVTLPAGEIFPALQSGAIDATEWIGPWNDLAFGFYKIVKYYYYPGFHEPGTGLGVGINMEVWESFTKSQKAIIRDAMAAEQSVMVAEFDGRNAQALEVLLRDHGVKLRRFSDDILRAIRKVSAEVVAKAAESDAMSKKVYDSYTAFQKSIMGWSDVTAHAYENARRLPD